MGTILWKNLCAIPAETRDALCAAHDELGHFISERESTDVIFVYLRCGDVIEVRPATAVTLNGDTLTVLNGKEPVARYPREQVVQATRQPVEPTPFD